MQVYRLEGSRAGLEKVQGLQLQDPGNLEWKQREEASRTHYIKILSSVIDIIKQQSNVEWISYGDECTKYFFC